MKVSKKINPYAIEIDFKTELMSKCDVVLKKYIKDKLVSAKSKRRTKNLIMLMKFYERFLVKHQLDVEYAIIASLIFCNEFTIIREQVEMGLIDFKHFRDPNFWDSNACYQPENHDTHSSNTLGGNSSISAKDAIFFVYTTMDNFYPQTHEVICKILDITDKNPDLDCYRFFEDITYI
ncbi:hypothetical protein [Photobacterium damselae]|uniref:hypothetical protein n=1 Tax=Photobacterium damselae TaxID=38293 RepID=UPI0040677D47